jgi:aerobic carbon-monoxide dehydrogenase medium subunit
MKAVAFDYERPSTIAQALALLEREEAYAKVLAGGQSLGPMLNLRLVQPQLLVDISRVPEMTRIEESADATILGACTTHSTIEDGRVPAAVPVIVRRVAAGIAYRAVRNRGTIGGSLAHADPAADWLVSLAAIGAEALISGAGARRSVPVAQFMIGAFETALGAAELLDGVRIPCLSARVRWGFYKFARKTGEFAKAMAAVLIDPEAHSCRVVMGATESTPIVFDDGAKLFAGKLDGALRQRLDRRAVVDALKRKGRGDDAIGVQLHLVALERALAQVEQQ